jgi:hypothetical protein
MAKIELHKELLLHIAGEEEKNNIISWEVLKKIGDSTQELINVLAKFSLQDKPINEEYTKLRFTGFFKGSAVAAFKLPAPPNLLFETEPEFKALDIDFTKTVTSINKGNFQEIADRYNTPEVRNKVIDAVYNFTNSAGTRPFSIVQKQKPGVYKPLAKVRPMTIQQKNLMLIVPKKTSDETSIEVNAVHKVKISKTSTGKTTTKTLKKYIGDETTPALRFDSIEANGKIYVLHNEVVFCIIDDKPNIVNIENTMLDIYATGSNLKEAEQDMSLQFDYTYQRLNQIPNDKLSEHLLKAKNYINLLVHEVKDI